MLKVVVMGVGLFLVIVTLAMLVVAVKLAILQINSSNGNGGLSFLIQNAEISQGLCEITGRTSLFTSAVYC